MSDLRVNIGGNASGFKQATEAAKMHARSFTNSVTTEVQKSWGGMGKAFVSGIAGMFTAQGIKGFITGLFNEAKSLRDLTEQFDLNADSLQRWQQALDKAGVSQNTFFRALETLRAKRAEAREDPKKLAPFTNLGLGAAAMGTDVGDEELLRMVLGSGKSRAMINEVLGRSGAKLKGALGDLGGPAVFSEQDLKDAGGLEAAAKSFWKAVEGKAVKELRDTAATVRGDMPFFETKGNLKLMDAGRQLDAKLAAVKERAEARRDKLDSDRILAEKEQAKIEKTAEALAERRTKELEKIADKEASKKGALHGKMPEISADALAKVGLFTSSSLPFSPLLNVQQQQLRVLNRIADNTGKGSDPFR